VFFDHLVPIRERHSSPKIEGTYKNEPRVAPTLPSGVHDTELPAGPDHRAAELMQPCPSGFVALKAQNSLQTKGACAVLLGRYPPDRAEPDREWSMGILEDCAGCNRSQASARSTAIKKFAYRPAASIITARAAKSVRPAQAKEIFPAGGLSRKLCF